MLALRLASLSLLSAKALAELSLFLAFAVDEVALRPDLRESTRVVNQEGWGGMV